MSNPLLEIRALLMGASGPVVGIVSSTTNGIDVATRNGVVKVTSSIPVAVDDSVVIDGGVIKLKLKSQRDLPTYYL